MKKILAAALRPILQAIISIWVFAGWKACFKYYSEDGNNIEFCAYYKARWYSPFFWVSSILKLVVCFFSGGLTAATYEIVDDITTDGDGCARTQKIALPEELSGVRLRWHIFVTIYTSY